MINNTVSRTCVAVRSLDGGQHIKDLTTVKVIIRQRKEVPFGTCEPFVEAAGGYNCPPVLGQIVLVPSTWLTYPAHDFNEDKTRICFHWDRLLWAKPPGRYMATVYLCGVAIGCFQMQVGKRFTAEDPVNVAFNECEAVVAICDPAVEVCTELPAVVPSNTIGWYQTVLTGTGTLNNSNFGSSLNVYEGDIYYGGVIEGVAVGSAVAIQTVWEPLAWASYNLAAQVPPTVTISATGKIAVTPQRVVGGNPNQMSQGTIRVTASVASTLARNRLNLSVAPGSFYGALLSWTIDQT